MYVCAWCGERIKADPEQEKKLEGKVSHGVCLKCNEAFELEADELFDFEQQKEENKDND